MAVPLSPDCEASIPEGHGESYHHYQRRMKENPHARTGATINETVGVGVDMRGIIEGTAMVDDFLGAKPVRKIDIRIPSFAPRIVHLVTAKGRTVK